MTAPAPVTAVARLAELTVENEQLRAEVSRLRRELDGDGLTGLLGRRGFTSAYALAHRRVLVLLDLDGFKPVNDTWGHAAGDEVLCVVAVRIAQHADVAARLGGDEFVALVEHKGSADRIRALVATPIRLSVGAEVTVTASVGVALSLTGDLAGDMRRADQAMYRAKRSGGGRVAVWDHRDEVTPTACQRGQRRTPTGTPRVVAA